MSARLLEAVPNFSEGRDEALMGDIVSAMRISGADVLDWSADPDHHRMVVTVVGQPEAVEDAALAGARVAIERIDLRKHRGVHPRIGALDVLPFVPLTGLSMADARSSAHRVGARIAHDLGVPVFFYADASQPPGRTLPVLRRGGFEALTERWPDDRVPDLLPANYAHAGAHPTAGASCVGARELLLAWNVILSGIPFDVASAIAESLRERTGGFTGVRALALRLPSRGALQISMNLEQLEATPPILVFRRLETLVTQAGGRIEATEVIGMIPDALVLSAAADRLRLSSPSAERLLSKRLLAYLGDTERGSLQPTTPGSTDE